MKKVRFRKRAFRRLLRKNYQAICRVKSDARWRVQPYGDMAYWSDGVRHVW